MSKFSHHRYEYTNRFSPRHMWEIVGPEGGVHFHASLTKGYPPSCGLEFHHNQAAWLRMGRDNEAFHHRNCPLLGGPCWHDGTSLYASETLWPIIKSALERGDHDSVFRCLEREYNDRFNPAEAAP